MKIEADKFYTVEEVAEFLRSAPMRVMVTEMHDKTAPDRMREEAARLLLKYAR